LSRGHRHVASAGAGAGTAPAGEKAAAVGGGIQRDNGTTDKADATAGTTANASGRTGHHTGASARACHAQRVRNTCS